MNHRQRVTRYSVKLKRRILPVKVAEAFECVTHKYTKCQCVAFLQKRDIFRGVSRISERGTRMREEAFVGTVSTLFGQTVQLREVKIDIKQIKQQRSPKIKIPLANSSMTSSFP